MTIQDDLIRDEGVRLKPYKDTVGKLTIGVGRNLDDVGISETEAVNMLTADIERAESALRRNFHWFIIAPEPVQRGLTNMAFNLGMQGLLGFRRMLSCLNAGDYAGAADAALDSNWAKQVGARAQRIADLFRSCAVKTGATS